VSAITHVRVEAEPDGALLVTWEVAGAATAVHVAVGSSPEGVDHEHVVSVEPGTTSTRLHGLRPGRHFVSVSPQGGGSAVIAADRRVAFAGLKNFRDLGGYPVRDGGWTRWGRVFRADALHGLTSDDLAVYHGLGIRSVYDLRRDVERQELPNPVESEALAFLSNGSTEASQVMTATLLNERDGQEILRALYVGLLEHAAPQIGALLGALADEARLPAVFHCHAGKDRTGVAAALLLEALGVPREHVLDDYELTSRYRRRGDRDAALQRLLASGISPEAAAGVMTAPRWAMAGALAELDQRYGGVNTYLVTCTGFTDGQLARLRELLVSR